MSDERGMNDIMRQLCSFTLSGNGLVRNEYLCVACS